MYILDYVSGLALLLRVLYIMVLSVSLRQNAFTCTILSLGNAEVLVQFGHIASSQAYQLIISAASSMGTDVAPIRC